MQDDFVNEIPEVVSAETPSNKQTLFLRYFIAILIDLVVLNLFAQYWDRVFVDAFSTSLLVAILLQVLLKLALAIEHRVAAVFAKKEGISARVMRALSAWAILFVSKLIILAAINQLFGDRVVFEGNHHGVVAFLVVVVVMLVAEEAFLRLYHKLR